jgi:putative SOS response-associated peptidase YedK
MAQDGMALHRSGNVVLRMERQPAQGATLVCSRRERPLFAFAGIWRPWTGERKGEAGRHELFSFLTTEPNEVVRPVHAKAMPVLLTAAEDWDTWLTGPVDEALALQRPLPDEMLRVVAADDKTDGTLPA